MSDAGADDILIQDSARKRKADRASGRDAAGRDVMRPGCATKSLHSHRGVIQ